MILAARDERDEMEEQVSATVKQVQVTFDCAGPAALADFWAEALGYRLGPPPSWLRELGRASGRGEKPRVVPPFPEIRG
jgi:hypothetical protein